METNYKYPMGLDLSPKSVLHEKLVKEIKARATASKSEMEKRYGIWDCIKDKLTVYIKPPDEKSKERRILDKDPDTPTTVIIPISYAVLDTLLTYYVNAFGDGPIFHYDAVGPEDKPSAKLLEHLVNDQARRAKTLLSLYVQWRDALAYGIGITSVRWHEEYGRRTVTREVPDGIDYVTGEPIMIEKTFSERVKQWEGSVVDNISPWNYFPDPEVPCHKIQDAEFIGFLTKKNYTTLLNLERNNAEVYFNVRSLKGKLGRSFLAETPKDDATVHIEGSPYYPGRKDTKSFDILSFYWELVPSEWGLGRSVYPEKWLFELAGADMTIIRAQPINLNHNRFPVTVCSPTFDGYTSAPSSILEIIYEMQNAIDWLWKSRVKSVNATQNPKMVIDPFLVRYDQAIDNEQNVACIREHVWGRGVQNTMEQVRFTDVTPNHIHDIENLSNIIQRVSGAVDSVQGVVQPTGERRSATEMRDARTSAMSRIQKGTRLVSMQSIHDLGLFMAYHTQQFMEQETYVHLVGDNYKDLMLIFGEEYVPVSPEDIQINFDILPTDAVTPGGEYLPELIQLFQLSHAHPAASMQFDPVKQILDIYMRAGVKGAYQFLVVPDDEAAAMAASIGAEEAPMDSANAIEGTLNAAPRPS